MLEEMPTCDWCAIDLEERYEDLYVGGDRVCEACMVAYWMARSQPAQEDSPPQT